MHIAQARKLGLNSLTAYPEIRGDVKPRTGAVRLHDHPERSTAQTIHGRSQSDGPLTKFTRDAAGCDAGQKNEATTLFKTFCENNKANIHIAPIGQFDGESALVTQIFGISTVRSGCLVHDLTHNRGLPVWHADALDKTGTQKLDWGQRRIHPGLISETQRNPGMGPVVVDHHVKAELLHIVKRSYFGKVAGVMVHPQASELGFHDPKRFPTVYGDNPKIDKSLSMPLRGRLTNRLFVQHLEAGETRTASSTPSTAPKRSGQPGPLPASPD